MILAGFSVPSVGYLVFRESYYGDLLPNAAYAKGIGLGLARQAEGSLGYFRQNLALWAPLLVCSAIVHAASEDRRAARLYILGVPLVLAVMFSGGDWMSGGRLIAPIMVLIALVTGLMGRSLRQTQM